MIDLDRLSDRDRQTVIDALVIGYRQMSSNDAYVQARLNGQVPRDLEVIAKLVKALRSSNLGTFSASPVHNVFLLSELDTLSIRNECLTRRAQTKRLRNAYQSGHDGLRQTEQGVWLLDRMTAKEIFE